VKWGEVFPFCGNMWRSFLDNANPAISEMYACCNKLNGRERKALTRAHGVVIKFTSTPNREAKKK